MTGPDTGREQSDLALLTAAQADPESEEARQAACLLLSRYRDRVYAWCYRRLDDPDRAMDATQEVLLSAYRRLGSFQGRSEFSSWLFVIARNRCWTELRRPHLVVDEETSPEDARDAGRDPADAYIESRSEQEILGLIRTHLDPLEQKVLWLRCFERIPVDRITEMLEIREVSGARGVLQRARRRLRAALQKADSSRRPGND